MLCRHSGLGVSLNPGVGRDEHAWVPGGSKLVREGGDRLGPAPPFQLRGHLLIGTRGRRGQVPGPPVRVPVAVRHLGQGQVQRLLDGDCPRLELTHRVSGSGRECGARARQAMIAPDIPLGTSTACICPGTVY